ncbi:MAG: helix-turn-helix transcriptional regulator [Desulfotomaculaceae bacterium]
MLSLGHRLTELRKEKGLSQIELAQRLNMGQSTIAMYERDKRCPDNKTLERLAGFFNVSVDYLLGLTNTRERLKLNQSMQAMLSKFSTVLEDPLFVQLLSRIPDLTPVEKESLAEYWDWALKVIEKERARRDNPVIEKKNL